MARIGNTTKQSQIYDYALKRYESEFMMTQEGANVPASGQTAYQSYLKISTPQKLIFAPYNEPEFYMGDTKEEQKALVDNKLQIVSGLTNNKKISAPKNMYQLKVGTRSEGNYYDQAKTKPYVDLTPDVSGLHGDIHQQAPAVEMLNDNEIFKLTTVYKDDMIKPKNKYEKKMEEVMKVNEPSERDILVQANQDVGDFMKHKLGATQVYPSTETNQGSVQGNGYGNMRVNSGEELNRGIQPKTTAQLYQENFKNPKPVSNVNLIQRDAQEARDTLSVFGNRQHLSVSEQVIPSTKMPHKYMSLISKKKQ